MNSTVGIYRNRFAAALSAWLTQSSYSHYYGATAVLQSYLGVEHFRLRRNVVWQHGWAPVEKQISAEALLDDRVNASSICFVARCDEAVFLRSLGFRAHATSLPYVYASLTDTTDYSRDFASVFPVKNTQGSKIVRFDKYWHHSRRLLSLAATFGRPRVVLHSYDFEVQKAFWASLGASDIVLGADPNDSSSLFRLVALFRSSSVVVSDSLGSHIPYAGFEETPVVLQDTPDYVRTEFNAAFHTNAAVRQQLLDEYNRRQRGVESPFGDLYSVIGEPIDVTRWARHQLGTDSVQPASFFEKHGKSSSLRLKAKLHSIRDCEA